MSGSGFTKHELGRAQRIARECGIAVIPHEEISRIAYVNPPYSAQLLWLRRAYEQWLAGKVEMVVCLVPVRTDSAWFHKTLAADAEIFFLQGRLRFAAPSGKAQHTPFSLMLVALGTSTEQRERLSRAVPGMWT